MAQERGKLVSDGQRWMLRKATGLEIVPFAGEHLDDAAGLMAANYRAARLLDPSPTGAPASSRFAMAGSPALSPACWWR